MTNTIFRKDPVSMESLFNRSEALFRQAEIALSKEQTSVAEYFFEAGHNKDIDNPELLFIEAKLWQRYGKILKNSDYLQRSYRKFKPLFSNQDFQLEALTRCLELKFDEFELNQSIGSVIQAKNLISKLQKIGLKDFNIKLFQAKCLFHQSVYYKDLTILDEAKQLFLKLLETKQRGFIANYLAEIHVFYFEWTRDLSHLLNALNFRKQACEIETQSISIHLDLAKDHQRLFFATIDEQQIEKFHEVCQIASILRPDSSLIYLIWSQGLIKMGIHVENLDWVKLGIEKSYEASTYSAPSEKIDLQIARGLAYLGKKMDRLSHIQESFDKIKSLDEDPLNPELVITICEILIAYGSYYQDLDYFYQAIEKLQESLSLNSHQREFWLKMAQLYLEISHYDQSLSTIELAIKMVDKGLSFYKCQESLILKASIFMRYGEFKQSAEIYEESLRYFEEAFQFPIRLFQPRLSHHFEYAKVLDHCGNYHEDENFYYKALEQLTHIILIDPHYPHLHHQIALTQFHLSELTMNPEIMKKSLVHFKLASQDSGIDNVYVDWAIACLTLSEMVDSHHEAVFLQHEAANKLRKALKQGNMQALYFMACLCCVCEDFEKSITCLKHAERHDALPPVDDLIQDEWLEPLHRHDEFIKLVERQEMKKD